MRYVMAQAKMRLGNHLINTNSNNIIKVLEPEEDLVADFDNEEIVTDIVYFESQRYLKYKG